MDGTERPEIRETYEPRVAAARKLLDNEVVLLPA
jgi:hypothetical protein